MGSCNKRGFTLIEIMLVVAVMLVLSGLLFRIGGLAVDRSNRAKAMADLQSLANALEEFYAEYGMYPPVSTMAYVFENTSLQPPSLRTSESEELSDAKLGYRYGLVSYLVPRDRGSQRVAYKADTPRDVAAKQRWAHYLADLNFSGGSVSNNLDLGGLQVYSNSTLTIVDPWGSAYRYGATAPYLTYTLTSGGPPKGGEISVSTIGQ